MRGLLVSLLVMVPLCPAWAQTAEETAAYIFFQAENGGTFEGSPPGTKLTQESSSPAKFVVSTNNGGEANKVSFSSTKIDPCVYQSDMIVTESGKIVSKLAVLANFNTVSDVKKSVTNGVTTLSLMGSDSCTFKVGVVEPSLGPNVHESCADKAPLVFATEKNIDRVNKAIAYLKANFCKGRAF